MVSISSITTKESSYLSQGNFQHLFKNTRLRLVSQVALTILVFIGVLVTLRKCCRLLFSYTTRIHPLKDTPVIPQTRESFLSSISEYLSIPNNHVLLSIPPGSDINEMIEALAYQKKDKTFFLLESECLLENYFSKQIVYSFDEVVSSLPPQSVLIIHDFHHILSQIDASLDARSLWKDLKKRANRERVQYVAIITEQGRVSLAKDEECLDLFNQVPFPPLNVETCTSWLLALKEKYEKEYKCTFTEEAIKKAVKLADSYITNKTLPGSALEILKAASKDPKRQSSSDIDDTLIIDIFSRRNNIPLRQLKSEKDRIIHLKKVLAENVFGQSEAIEAVVKAFKLRIFCTAVPTKPVGSFLFVGPTGTGKTLLAHQIAKDLFNDATAVLRIDMSNMVAAHCVSMLIGVPPGYVGHDSDSHLTRKVQNTPRCVVIFDEAEKAHAQVLNIFLRLLETGYMTDARGKIVDFRQTFIIATSNLGSNLNFVDSLETLKQNVQSALKERLPPEILGRFDETLIFQPLEETTIGNIIRKGVEEKIESLAKGTTKIVIEDSVYGFLQAQNKDNKQGARPILRSIDTFVISPLIDRLIESPDQTTITVSATADKIVLS